MNKKILIFGCGYHGRAVYRNLDDKNIIGWVDNNKNFQNKKLFNKKIFDPKKINKINFNFIILAGRNVKEIFSQLINLKIDKKKIIFWGNSKLIPQKKKIKKRNDSYRIIFRSILKIFKLNNINYWVDRSGLLSLCREKKYCMLSDFDLAVNNKDINKLFKLLKSSNKYKVVKKRGKINKIYIKSLNSILDYEPAIVDFIFLKFNKKNVHHFYNNYKFSKKKYFLGHDIIKFDKLNFKIPLYVNNYLRDTYGKNWRKRPEFWENKKALINIKKNEKN